MIRSIEDAVNQLRKQFPRFEKYAGEDDRMSYDSDLPYLLFGDFAIFVREKLDQLAQQKIKRDDEDLRQAFHLIGELIESGRPDILEIVEVGILETISGRPLATEIAEQNLNHPTFETYKSLVSMIDSASGNTKEK